METVLFNVIICLISSVSIVFVKKLSPAVELKITLAGGIIMEMMKSMVGCGTIRDGYHIEKETSNYYYI